MLFSPTVRKERVGSASSPLDGPAVTPKQSLVGGDRGRPLRPPRLTIHCQAPSAPSPPGILCPLQVEKTSSGKKGASSGRCSFAPRLRGWAERPGVLQGVHHSSFMAEGVRHRAPVPCGARALAAPTPFQSGAVRRGGRLPAPCGAARGPSRQPRVCAGRRGTHGGRVRADGGCRS